MTDRPILFSAPMVRAMLDGTKTQTRRVMRHRDIAIMEDTSSEELESLDVQGWECSDEGDCLYRPLFAVGDRLWVREHWKTAETYNDVAPRDMGGEEAVKYLADGYVECWGWPYDARWGRHRQGMHMPRWASRLTLTVTDVRVQRLQKISAQDSIAEGVECETCIAMRKSACHRRGCFASIDAFHALWDSINAERGFGWDENPWVCALTFTVHRCNIDEAT